jgi:ADP-ribose pyrophosphatase
MRRSMGFTVAIGVGLTDSVLGSEERYVGGAGHVGRVESERLLGAGRDLGRGVIPTFLAELDHKRREGAPVGVLLLRECVSGNGAPSDSLVAPIVPYLAGAEVLPSAPARIPWRPLTAAIRRVTGVDPTSLHGNDDLRFLVFGCHTEHSVFSTALLLRSVFGSTHVAVSPFLVGSAMAAAHLAVLSYHLPAAGVQVLLNPAEVTDFLGVDVTALTELGCSACALQPDELRDSMPEQARRMVELLCIRWSKAHLRLLGGGFSGSMLLLASGWRGDARTEPMVIKVDRHNQMRKEIDGYHLVKDLLGKHVPTFNWPVVLGDSLAVGMDLAAMEGSPESLQDVFEHTESEPALDRFISRLEKALGLVADRLYRNTRRLDWFSPYRAFHLHTDVQQQWLAENVAAIRDYWEREAGTALPVDEGMVSALLHMLARNDDGVEGEVCLVHGDLNFRNMIADEVGNVWFIDWTHCGRMPVELDFAKLENDVKFVMSKEFELGDLERLRQMESYLLTHRIPSTVEDLPAELRFVLWDLRFRRIFRAVKCIRETCFGIKGDESWLVYRAALLKYALHSISFDKRRGRGECDLPQLMFALHSLEGLLNDLIVDDFHLKIRGERPASYPPRQRVSIDSAPWPVECAGYDPPYYVSPQVLANDRTRVPGGWADPEEFTHMPETERAVSRFRDPAGRPLHPFGRTGIAGRGELGCWGPNYLVSALVTRRSEDGGCDILLGRRDGADSLEPPHCFARKPGDCCAALLVERETGWRPEGTPAMLSEGYAYDARRTDHAWVVAGAQHLRVDGERGAALLKPKGDFEAVSWFALSAETINRMPPGFARQAREAVRALQSSGVMNSDLATAVLDRTG